MPIQKTKEQAYKADNVAFIKSTSRDKDYQATESGVLYKIIECGHGKRPTTNSLVLFDCIGSLIDETIFENTYDRGRPSQFKMQDLIKGLRDALKIMPCGSKWEIIIPYELGYGARNYGNIPAHSSLIFELELLDVR